MNATYADTTRLSVVPTNLATAQRLEVLPLSPFTGTELKAHKPAMQLRGIKAYRNDMQNIQPSIWHLPIKH